MSILQDLIRPDVLLTLAVLALIFVRLPVRPRVSMLINTAPDKLFSILDIYDGKTQDYGRGSVSQTLIDAAREIYKFNYTTIMHSGRVRNFSAQFRVAERVPGQRLVLIREGLEGKPKANQLLTITHQLEAEGTGTRLRTTYDWGPRLMLAQLIARADLLGGTYRTKGLAETGEVNELPYTIISMVIAALSALLSVVAFAFFFDVMTSMLIVFSLFFHEMGHILAYRMIGQPWGRVMFLPFLGAVAIPKLPFEKQSHLVFSALMGPAFSVLLAGACYLALRADVVPREHLFMVTILGLTTVLINVLNLVPIEPLDGGVVLRSILARLAKSYARYCLLVMGLAVAAVGLYYSSLIVVLLSAMAIAFNIKPRVIDEGLTPMSKMQLVAGSVTFFALGAIYAGLMAGLIPYLRG
jgi:Zn-dependent protease